jgi:PAS domain S-box-containing protein
MPQPLLCNQPENADHAQLYEMLVAELTDFVVFLMDPTGCIMSWNPGVERILGYTEAEWLGQSTEMIFTPEDRAQGRSQQEMTKAVRDGRAPDIRWHLHKNGGRLYVDGTMVALRDETGQLLGFSKVMRDITERKKQELALQDAVRYAESIVDTVREPLLVLDSALRVRSANRSFYRQFQVSPEETQDQLLYQLGNGQWNISSLRTLLEEVLPQDKAVESLEVEADLPFIGRKVLLLNARKLWREGNHTELILLAFEDITERKQRATQQAALLELGDRLRELRHPADMAGIAAALLGRTLGVARAGYGRVDATEQTITVERDWTNGQVEHATGSYRFADYGAALAGILKLGEAVVIPDVAKDPRTADGAENFAALGVRALLDVPLLIEGRLAGALHLHHSVPRAWSEEEIRFVRKMLDRTWTAMEYARAETEREQLLAEVKRSNEDLAQFAHVVSHDLQAPIRGMKSFSQLLMRHYAGQLDATAQEYLQLIQTGAESMSELIQTLLSYATVGQEAMTLGLVSLNAVLEAVVMSLRPVIAETGAGIESQPLPGVRGDRVLLQQLLQNLISNAIKYRKPEEAPRILVSAQCYGDFVTVSVKDNGQGIAPRYHQQIFTPLKRLHGPEIGGTGIGLAICKRIVERHGGRIWVESQSGEGATFFFTLPREGEPSLDRSES